jgi:hypothetical protein
MLVSSGWVVQVDGHEVALPGKTRASLPEQELVKFRGDGTAELLKDEIGRVDAVMLRTDTKAGLLLAVFSPITAVGAALLTRVSLQPTMTVLLVTAAALLGTAVLLLLWTIRPRLSGSPLKVYQAMTHEQVAQHFARVADDMEKWQCEYLILVSGLATRKFRLVRLASTLIGSAALVLAATVVGSMFVR